MTRLIPEVDRVFLGPIGDADTAFMVRRADAIDIAGHALVLQVGYDPQDGVTAGGRTTNP